MRSHLLVVALASFASCAREPRSTGGSAALPTSSAASESAPIASTSTKVPNARVFPGSTASPANAPAIDDDIVHRQLRTAPIKDLKIVSWSRPGLFDATLERPNSDTAAHVTLRLALDQSPIAYRRPLAYALLSRALGMRVVPATVLRRVSTGELGAFFDGEPNVRAYLSARAAIQNDGTIDALVIAPSRGDDARAWNVVVRRDIVLDEAPEARAWARWAASAEAFPDENPGLLRDYGEALVLDYLTCNIMRRSVALDEAASELVLAEYDGAFPLKLFPEAEAKLLDRLKPVVRFPRTLRDALMKLDRKRAREVLMPGTFETWLVAPRTIMTLDERRMTLLTLIESRIAQYGEKVVLSL